MFGIPTEDLNRAFEIRQAEEWLVVVTMEHYRDGKRLPAALRRACERLDLPQRELARRREALALLDAMHQDAAPERREEE